MRRDVHLDRLASAPPHPGGRGEPAFDLFLSWAHIEGLALLGRVPANGAATAGALRALNGHHGVGSQPGQPADRWATSYFALLHRHLGIRPPAGAGQFLLEGMSDGSCWMHDGEAPSMWSNWLSAEAVVSVYRAQVPAPALSVEHVVASQSEGGGIGWGPAWARAGRAELRASGFALRWMAVIGRFDQAITVIDRDALIAWVRALQDPAGGFRLQPEAVTPCLWATAEALDLLHRLDVHVPAVNDAAADFALDNLMSDGGFRRGAAYDHSDLWSTRNGARVLRRTQRLEPAVIDGAAAFLAACEAPHGGATYRPGVWAEAYTTAAGVLAGTEEHPEDAVDFLHHLRMPEDGGFAYMPGRGAEARTLRFAGLAAAMHGRRLPTEPSLAWARSARNPDGGWGVYDGRSSSTNTTCAVLAEAKAAGELGTLVSPELAQWMRRRWLAARRDPLDLVELSLLERISGFVGTALPKEPLRTVLHAHEVDGGWFRKPGDGADLHTTYQALLAHQQLGSLPQALERSVRWLQLLERPGGMTWSPLSNQAGGALPAAFAELIRRAHCGAVLPDLVL